MKNTKPPAGGVRLPVTIPANHKLKPTGNGKSPSGATPTPTQTDPQQAKPRPTPPSHQPPSTGGPSSTPQPTGQVSTPTPSIATSSTPSVEPAIQGPPQSYSNLAIKPNSSAANAIGKPRPVPPPRIGKNAPPSGQKATDLFASQMVSPPRPLDGNPPATEAASRPMPTFAPPPVPNSVNTEANTSPAPKAPMNKAWRQAQRFDKLTFDDPSVQQTPNTPSNTPSISPAGSSQQASSSQQVGGVQSAPLPGAEFRRQQLDSLIDRVATGELQTPAQIYTTYNRQNNAFSSKTEEQHVQGVQDLGEKFKAQGGNTQPFKSEGGKPVGHYLFSASGHNVFDTKERIYLNAKSDHAVEVMDHIVTSHLGKDNNPGLSAAKIWSAEDIKGRNDAIVIYSESPGATKTVVDGLQQYQATHKGHFHDEVPMMTRPQSGIPGVSVADNPRHKDIVMDNIDTWGEALHQKERKRFDILREAPAYNVSSQGGDPSFGQVRTDAIWLAAQHPNVKNEQGQIDPTKLRQETDKVLRLFNADPTDPSQNLRK
ncbi:MAG: hypothetical protein H6727_17930 [Myxococcales bacterium]|nr:hypothetical protein [Myxococcales bacterium]